MYTGVHFRYFYNCNEDSMCLEFRIRIAWQPSLDLDHIFRCEGNQVVAHNRLPPLFYINNKILAGILVLAGRYISVDPDEENIICIHLYMTNSLAKL
ncbi:hypothetical protein IGI04_003886 [Brassica rapa subsp. trilocularis]|uniref:Uncharacterized protein n=1 Tax=Brassica rapa subsp. trilocularis TaxID=1813537 RepID=A0ABQ7NZR5_BRACM|nr:hypothetical protein IGI04_003886 [Brassica rapa subsp. trilocularis]